MIMAGAAAGYALLAGAAVPYALARAGWPHRSPALGVLAWQGLTLSFIVATALAVYHLVLTDRHVHDGLVGLLSACGPGQAVSKAVASPPTVADAALLLMPATVVLLPLGWLARTAWHTRRERRRHADLLAMVGTDADDYGVTIVEYTVPAVYCLPGRGCRIVVTRGALDVLTDEQLRAALEHERAHILGRHHLLRLFARAFARAFPGLPLARLAEAQTALLLEMNADDRALRFHSRDALATALCEVAAGRVPAATLGASGPGALIRLRRILSPQTKPHRATGLGVVIASIAAPILPLLLVCVH
ncbi:M56 family metallopeptidase [Streptomyces albipurpureus]|uniref:M56 family metallopeptidase n=1 Tax=Streptomyces albipurpureus TaxID=2897419 RepID=A0ABT0UXX5_9ACTN|nr:M56 family metallopeptidase [Streptomyces sp. CWNU-1]MCM2392799.1 M56 family metallopeptidase [Streptomyces sp. CWNU-1]